jgi:hypothetical protein
MIKSKLTIYLLLLCSVSFADELSLTNGYIIENVELVSELNDIVQYKGMDIVISLTPDQILVRQLKIYDLSKPSRFVLVNKKMYENFYKDDNIRSDTAFQMKITMMHGETISGNLYQYTDSVVVFHANYGSITIAKDLIVDPVYLDNKSLKEKHVFTVTMFNGESFDGEKIFSTDSSVTYRTNMGIFTVLKRNIKNICNAVLDNKTFLLGDTFSVTMGNGEFFNGVLLSTTDSTETYHANMGILTVSKRNIRRNIMTVCSAPLDSKYLLFRNSFKVAMLNGESFNGLLISSTDSTVTYQTAIDSITVFKKNIMTVLNTSLDDKSIKSIYTSTVAMLNKKSFRGKRIASTDSTETYRTNVGDVTILKKNIMAVGNTFKDIVDDINDASISLPSLFSIYVGGAIPMGDFARTSTSGGGAQTGFTTGIQFVTGGRIGLLLDINFSSNSMNTDAMKNALKNNLQRQYGPSNISVNSSSTSNWNNILFLAGLKIGTKNLNSTNYFIAPIIGLDLSISPEISGDYSGNYYSSNPQGLVNNTFTGHVTQTSASNEALVYGATAEVIISDRYTISAQYISCKLNYDLTYSDNSNGPIIQNISFFQLCIGVVF